MTQHHVLDQLPLWVEGDLDAAGMASVEGHLVQCPACQQAAEQLKISQAWLRDALASPFSADHRDSLRRGVMEQIRAEAATRPVRRFNARPALLAACAASLFVATLLWQQQRGSAAQGDPLPVPLLPKVAERPSQTAPQPDLTVRMPTPAQPSRPSPERGSESPPSSEPARIEFQTSDPTIRIIWLAQARPHPDTLPPTQEEP